MSGNDEELDNDAFFAKALQESRKKLLKNRRIQKEKKKLKKKRKKKRKKVVKKNVVDNYESKLISGNIGIQRQGWKRREKSIAVYETPLDLLNHLQRDINTLRSSEKSKKIVSISKIFDHVMDSNSETSLFLFPHMYSELLKALTDATETVREKSIQLLQHFIKLIDPTTPHFTDCVNSLLLIGQKRFSKTSSIPFQETSEEIRKKFVIVFTDVLEKLKENTEHYLEEISFFLQRAYTDYFEVKILAFKMTVALCKIAPGIPLQAVSPIILKRLSPNLTHKRTEVRVNAILAFRSLVLTHAAEKSFHEYEKVIYGLSMDESWKVRSTLMDSLRIFVDEWRDRLGFAKPIIISLLMLMSDGQMEIQRKAFECMEKFGSVYEEVKEKDCKDTLELEGEIQAAFDLTEISKFYPSSFQSTRPRWGSRKLVKKHDDDIVDCHIELSTDWSLSRREKSFKLLEVMVYYTEQYTTSKLEKIISNIFKIYDDDEGSVQMSINECLVTMGRYVELSSYVELVYAHIRSQYSESPIFMTNVITTMNYLISGITDKGVTERAKAVLPDVLGGVSWGKGGQGGLQQDHVIYQPHYPLVMMILETVKSIAKVLGKEHMNVEIQFGLYIIALKISAQKKQIKESNSEEFEVKVFDVISTIVKYGDLGGEDDLFRIHFRKLVDELSVDMGHWDKTSPNLKTFEMVILRGITSCPSQASHVLTKIFPFISFEPVKMKKKKKKKKKSKKEGRIICDPHTKERLLYLLNHILDNCGGENSVLCEVENLLLAVILPQLKWMVGKQKEINRKLCLKCFHTIIEREFLKKEFQVNIEEEEEENEGEDEEEEEEETSEVKKGKITTITKNFDGVVQRIREISFSHIIGCLDEDIMEMRLIVAQLLPKYIDLSAKYMEAKDWKLLIEESIKLLNDVGDEIRIRITETYFKFFELVPKESLDSFSEIKNNNSEDMFGDDEDEEKKVKEVDPFSETVDKLLIHMDDNNPKVQRKIFECILSLMKLSEEKKKLVIEKILVVKGNTKRFQNFQTPSFVEKIINFC